MRRITGRTRGARITATAGRVAITQPSNSAGWPLVAVAACVRKIPGTRAHPAGRRLEGAAADDGADRLSLLSGGIRRKRPWRAFSAARLLANPTTRRSRQPFADLLSNHANLLCWLGYCRMRDCFGTVTFSSLKPVVGPVPVCLPTGPGFAFRYGKSPAMDLSGRKFVIGIEHVRVRPVTHSRGRSVRPAR